jgi:hypothetical protein
MILFALMAVVLLVIAGLAVDAGMSYFSSDQVERAAAAAALAGVAYLPGDPGDATNAAYVEAARNNFTSACPHSPCVTISQPATNQLKVTISVSVPTTFLELLGFGPHTVTRYATAEYLPPIALGQPGYQLGSGLGATNAANQDCNGIPTATTTAGYCTKPTSGLGTAGNFYILRSEGWGSERSEGDPYTTTPNDNTNGCGVDSTGSGSCLAATPDTDYHQISAINGTENSVSDLSNDGGQNYLITVPKGQIADVQIYNPSFAPNTDDNNNNTNYTLHEDDGDFPDYTGGTGVSSMPQSDYAVMGYTLFQVPTLASMLSNTEASQAFFYPFNATGLETGTLSQDSYFYWPAGSASLTTVSKPITSVPAMFHNWISVIQPSEQINAGTDLNYSVDHSLVTNPMQYNTSACTGSASATCYLDNASGTTEYFRLRVDTLNDASGAAQPIVAVTTTASNPADLTAGNSTAHKAYSIQVVPPSAVPGATCTGCTVSALDDLTVYTPVQGSQCQSFQIPLFYLDPSYFGQTISVDIFDVGDVGSGAAYVGILTPTATSTGYTPATCTTPPETTGASTESPYAQTAGIYDIGTSGTITNGPSYDNAFTEETAFDQTGYNKWASGSDAVIQSASSSGGALWNGQWLNFQVQVPSNYSLPAWCTTAPTNACYWDLYYSVASGATAGDTFAVTAGFTGSPDRLLPS